ncbi:MAG: hypothetical protein QOE98_2172 [Gaiellaceae bacterium]|nr:hypothetical protein [Gaiellaceae bacterium]
MRRLLVGLALLLVAVPAAAADVRMRVLPPVSGVGVEYAGVTYRTDQNGFVDIPGTRRVVGPENVKVSELKRGGRRYTFDRWFGATADAALVAGLRYYQRTTFSFRNLDHKAVPSAEIQLLRIKAQTGQVIERRTSELDDSVELLAQRVQPLGGGPVVKDVVWSAQSVQIRGTNVVRSSAQRFEPSKESKVVFELDFYPMDIKGVDAFFGRATGGEALVEFPDGHTQVYRLQHGHAVIPALPRGTYEVTIQGAGKAFKTPVALSKAQVAEFKVITWLDMAAVALFVALFTIGLVVIGRPHLLRAPARGVSRTRRVFGRLVRALLRRRTATGLLLLVAAAGAFGPGAREARAAAADDGGPPVLAYYYIWYTPTSWNRAKKDYPLLGRYDSGDAAVMRTQIRWAKESGIDGFIVSWKSTPTLDRRLATLVRIANAENFKLGIIYQGLDFERLPVPVAQVAEDLETFADRYAKDPAFKIFEKPLVIWSGTWEFTDRQIQEGTHLARDRMLVLGSARSTRDYERIAPYVDGNAYYWSSVNPATFPDYPGKLNAMSKAVHARSGLWIAPAAPGFDARDLGGKTVVPRNDGDMLRDQWSAAVKSSADAVGLISWNEFSENSHVEPSRNYGNRYLEVVAGITGARPPDVAQFESDGGPAGTSFSYGLPLAAAGVVLLVFGAALMRRRMTPRPPPEAT